ncbi:hypothetical protein CSC94_22500 [Zhengella mangrovi]|uniref:Uncharacterized protein n=1 Tax=Zhengella mangrovi TaxID=1982044 RepID=A0A2G1QH47_9HYPH|nr:hypothetical protein [Zhengella mangrovi]PHP64774.1 hypothetical protein CSC94_22500 [Zhengella mangrovi]
MTQFRRLKHAVFFAAVLLATVWMADRPGLASDISTQVAQAEEDIADLEAEIANDRKVEADLRAKVEESRRKGLKDNTLDWSSLEAKAIQGVGVVGPGINKPKIYQDLVNRAESDNTMLGRFNLKTGLFRVAVERRKEIDTLVAQRKLQLGLDESNELSTDDMRLITEIANQRALYIVEAERSRVIQGIVRRRVAELDKERQALVNQMTASEREAYDRSRAEKRNTRQASPDETATSADGEPGSQAEKTPDISYDPTDLRAAFAALERLINDQERESAALRNACESAGNAEDFAARIKQMETAGLPAGHLPAGRSEAEQAKLNELASLIAKIDALSRTVSTGSQKICGEARKKTPQLLPLKAEATATKEAAGQARKMHQQVQQLMAGLGQAGSTSGRTADRDTANEAISEHSLKEINDRERSCLQTSDLLLDALKRMEEHGKASEVGSRTAFALQHLEQAEAAGYEHADVYRERYKEFDARAGAMRDMAQYGQQCRMKALTFAGQCRLMTSHLHALRDRLLLDFKARYGERIEEDLRKLELVKDAKPRADDALVLIDRAVIEAENCVRAVEAKPQDQEEVTDREKSADDDRDDVTTGGCEAKASGLDAAVARIDQGDLAGAEGILTDMDVADCPDLGAKVRAVRTRIDERADELIAQGQAALDACEMKSDARDRVLALPPSPDRDALAAKWQDAFTNEKNARDLIRDAVRLNKGGQVKEAAEKLRAALAIPPFCEATRTKLVNAIAKLESRINDVETARIREMIAACLFKESRSLIRNLPHGPARQELANLWNNARDTEIEARKLIQTAGELMKEGELVKSKNRLQDALDLALCENTIARIGTVSSSLSEAELASDRTCANRFGHAHAKRLQDGNNRQSCECDEGYRWDGALGTRCVEEKRCRAGYQPVTAQSDGKSYCVPSQHTANAECAKRHGGQAYTGVNITERGTFDCRPSQAVADAACNRANGGSGYRAVNIRDDGRADCVAATHAAASNTCRKVHGQGWTAFRNRDGSWACAGPGKPAAKSGRQPQGGGKPKDQKCESGHIWWGRCLSESEYQRFRDAQKKAVDAIAIPKLRD